LERPSLRIRIGARQREKIPKGGRPNAVRASEERSLGKLKKGRRGRKKAEKKKTKEGLGPKKKRKGKKLRG